MTRLIRNSPMIVRPVPARPVDVRPWATCRCGVIFPIPAGVEQKFGQLPPPEMLYCSVQCHPAPTAGAGVGPMATSPSGSWIPKTDLDFARLHEAAHAIVARRLGSRTVAMLVCQDLDGYAVTTRQPGSVGVWIAATVSAAGPVIDRAFRRDCRRSRDDREQISADQRIYKEMTGKEMPCPYLCARSILDQDDVYQEVLLLTCRLIPGEVLSGVMIDALLD